jgi:hypothetical protein
MGSALVDDVVEEEAALDGFEGLREEEELRVWFKDWS